MSFSKPRGRRASFALKRKMPRHPVITPRSHDRVTGYLVFCEAADGGRIVRLFVVQSSSFHVSAGLPWTVVFVLLSGSFFGLRNSAPHGQKIGNCHHCRVRDCGIRMARLFVRPEASPSAWILVKAGPSTTIYPKTRPSVCISSEVRPNTSI